MDPMQKTLLLVAALLVVVVALIKCGKGGAWVRKCPECSGIVDGDPTVYRNIVVWTCRSCGRTFETIRP